MCLYHGDCALDRCHNILQALGFEEEDILRPMVVDLYAPEQFQDEWSRHGPAMPRNGKPSIIYILFHICDGLDFLTEYLQRVAWYIAVAVAAVEILAIGTCLLALVKGKKTYQALGAEGLRFR